MYIVVCYGFMDCIVKLRDVGGDMFSVNYEGVILLIVVEVRFERLWKEKEEDLKFKKIYIEL